MFRPIFLTCVARCRDGVPELVLTQGTICLSLVYERRQTSNSGVKHRDPKLY